VRAIDSFKPSARDVHKPLRLPVTDVFKSARGGAALGGRLAGGALKVGLCCGC
jgi:elongation factor 1 alpha-like protein